MKKKTKIIYSKSCSKEVRKVIDDMFKSYDDKRLNSILNRAFVFGGAKSKKKAK